MGPRFFDRGNRFGELHHLFQIRASMGPRFFDRGNQQFPVSKAGGMFASMGPRFFDRGNLSLTYVTNEDDMLQWGRGSLTAETATAA